MREPVPNYDDPVEYLTPPHQLPVPSARNLDLPTPKAMVIIEVKPNELPITMVIRSGGA